MAAPRSKKAPKWNILQVVAAAEKESSQRIHLCAILVRDEVKRSLNVGNADGSNPSEEGEPPHKVSGRLFGSITAEVKKEGTEYVGAVGTNVKYARRLEKGFNGTDSAGRRYRQGPRPFLVPGFKNALARIKRIMGVGKKK